MMTRRMRPLPVLASLTTFRALASLTAFRALVALTAFRALVALTAFGALGLGACRRGEPTARERLLSKISGDAVTVVVADGPAISHPRIRGALDVVAAHRPASMACVLEAAFAADQVALSIDHAGNLNALVAAASRPSCAALSQREPGLWIATIGAATAVKTSVLDDPRFARARPYLTTEPIAAVSFGAFHVLAAAQPDPLDAWVAIDVAGTADAVEQAVAEQVARMQRDPSTAAVASKLRTTRAGGGQLVIHLDGPIDGDLAVAARTVIAWIEERARPTAASFSCPTPDPEVTCSNGTSFRVRSLPEELVKILTYGRPSSVVTNGVVTGLRLEEPVARFGLVTGDIITAMGGRLVVSRAFFAQWIARAEGTTTVTIRRGTTEKVLEFVER
jgi:hypothetical protein